ncbi:hypothetical protein ABE205_26905 [Brevibacillus agri]
MEVLEVLKREEYIEWDRMQPDKIELLEAWERGVDHPWRAK